MDWIERVFGWLSSYRSPTAAVLNLQVKLEDIICLKADVKEMLQDAVSSGKKPKRAAKTWMRRARKAIIDAHAIREEARRMGWVAQIVNIPMTKRMEELIRVLVDLSEHRVLQDGLTLDNLHENRRLKFHTPRKLAGLAFVSQFDQIWSWLVKDGVLSIGIYGLGGVGKTTLAKCVFNKALKRRNPFQSVLWIDSSQIVSVNELQVAIAKQMYLDISHVEDEAARTALLSKTLKRKRECLVFLDGIWGDVSPEDVGIPLKKSRCRLIVTSRSIDVPRKMGCQELIKVEPLVEEEDWRLFMEKLGERRDLHPEIQMIAKSIVQKCSGIPLAVIVMATSMRGVVDICEWKNALNELEKSPMGGVNDMEKKVLPVLQLSFDRLNDSEVQQCFLVCALLCSKVGEIYRNDLIYYLTSTGLIRRMQHWRADFERGCTIVNRLVGSCLLSEVHYHGKRLAMSNLIRDMAIHLLETSPDMIVKVSEIPDDKEWTENLKMACLLLDYKIRFLSLHRESSRLGASPFCPRLRTFICCGKKMVHIPDSFFQGMSALEVLNLSYTRIEFLPSSIAGLKNLKALLLKGCRRLKYMPSLAELGSLKYLNISKSGITEIPHGLERLVNLTYLNLNKLEHLPIRVFPLGILPKLDKLEYLKVSGHLTVEEKELEGMKRLSTFEGRLSGLHSYSSYVVSRKHQGPKDYRFTFQRGYGHVKEDTLYDVNFVQIVNTKISNRERFLVVLPKDVEYLNIRDCKAMTSLCNVPSLEKAINLKKCWIDRCEDFSHLACFSSSCHLCRSHIFQMVEELRLDTLPQLSAIFGFDSINGQASTPVVAAATFSCLKRFAIVGCPKVKSLFQPELLPYLQNLEFIEVEECQKLEEIIPAAATSSSSDVNCEYSLPKLRFLRLHYLPNLKSICEERLTCDALEVIGVRNCRELNRITTLSPPPASLQSITVGGTNREEWWESVEWDSSSVKNDLQRFVSYT